MEEREDLINTHEHNDLLPNKSLNNMDKKSTQVKVIIGIIIITTLWMFSGIFIKKQHTEISPPSLASVKVEKSIASFQNKSIELNGVTQALQLVNLKSQIDGKIAEIVSQKGQYRKKGEVIAILESNNKKENLEQAKANYEKQLINFNSASAIFKSKLSSEFSLADAKAKLKLAESDLKAAEKDYEHSKILAPFDGYIDDILIEVGSYVSAMQNDVIGTFYILNPLKVITFIPERDITQINLNSEVQVSFPEGGPIAGNLKFISNVADNQTRTFKVEIEIPNNDFIFKSGQSVQVKIPLAKVKAHYIKKSSLDLDIKGNLIIKAVDDSNTVITYPVEIIEEDINGVWVTGLPDEVNMIVLGHSNVLENNKVNVN
jgi:multidrug efflux system membrane fusion protein